MREIKFKGLIASLDGSGQRWIIYSIGSKPTLVGVLWVIEDLQYTGLKDKNGRETYHKDICKDTELGELWLIEWDDEYAGFELQRITENTVRVKGILEKLSACRIVDFVEVIGNIYENPDLLEKQEVKP